MFTGLIERIGTVKAVSYGSGLRIEFAFEPWDEPLEIGESVAVNGVCLTVAATVPGRFTADILQETVNRAGMDELYPGTKVNLERAIKSGARLGGHIVQGHVDGRGTVMAKMPRGRDFSLKVKCGRVIAAGTVMKGSIAINGVSLTVTGLGEDWLQVDLIPTTARDTNLGLLKVGDKVNLESDVIGKYARRRYETEEDGEESEPSQSSGSGLTMEKLAECGFI